jgi:ABC-2 type transport system permease protein
MKIWNITRKDLSVFFRDRGALLYLFILPLVFILLFAGLGSRSQATSSDTTDQRTSLAVVNLDKGDEAAQDFIARLDKAGGYRVVEYPADEALNLLNRLKLVRYLVIPAGFSSDLAAGKPVSLQFITHPNSNPDQNQAALQVINGAAGDAALELQILDGLRQMGEMQAGSPEAQQYFTSDRLISQAKSQFERARQAPLVNVEQLSPAVGKDRQSFGFDFTQTVVPGFTVLFVFLMAQSVARSIFDEKRSGSLRRLMAAPIRRWELLVGKLVPNLILTLIQIIFIFIVGALFFPLLGFGKLTIGKDPFAWLLTTVLIALCATSLGIFISSIARTEGQISGLSTALLWIAGVLGGALVPAFIFPPFLQGVARLMPHYWATQTYYDLLVRGKTLVDVLPALGILLIFSALFFLIGARRFRFE